jgi:hypothetical protein
MSVQGETKETQPLLYRQVPVNRTEIHFPNGFCHAINLEQQPFIFVKQYEPLPFDLSSVCIIKTS